MSTLQQSLREAATRWRALPARDRLAASVAAIVVALAGLWLFATKPALDTVRRWQRDLPALQAQSTELDELLADVASAQAKPGEPLQAALNRAGLEGQYRFQTLVPDAPAGASMPAKAWRVEFAEPVPAERAFAWLVAVAARGDVEITGAALTRADNSNAAANAPSQATVRGVVDLQSTSLYKDGS